MEKSLNSAIAERHKVGRPMSYTPEDLIREAESYFAWCEANPFEDDDFVGKDATRVTRLRRRPFTLFGLCSWLGITFETFETYKERKEFSDYTRIIVDKIRSQQLEGATANHFNANIVARILGLSDNMNNNTNVSHAVAPEMLTELASILRNKGQDPTEG